MRAAVITFPGSNREGDVIRALKQATGQDPVRIWHQDHNLPDGTDLVVLPGGFSYGDYLRCGAMAAQSRIMRDVKAKADKGTAVVGICNGFQILTEAGLLPGALVRNVGLHFICRDVHLKVENTESMFTRRYQRGQLIRIPIAHADGNYRADAETLKRLEGDGRVAFRYVTATGEPTASGNPNGSANNIAGVFNEKRTVLGLMPHPERAIEQLLGGADGRAFFEGLAA